MGICTRRHFLLSICLLQLISTVERQVFDFLGYMWIPILVNFFEIIFVIFGFFGAFQYRPKYVISYSVWNLILLSWNIFLICLYLDIGILDHQESKVLKLDPDSVSWWQSNGPGCKVIYNTNASFPKLENVTDCLVDYRHVEVFHAGVQCLLALLGSITGFCLSRTFLKEDDSFQFLDGDSKNPQHLALQPMYVSYTSLPPNASSIPPYRLSLQSNNRRLGSFRHSTVEKCRSHSPCPSDVHLQAPSIESRLPLKSVLRSQQVDSVPLARSHSRPKIVVHADQIRAYGHGRGQGGSFVLQRAKSIDRLIDRDQSANLISRKRPKSLYSNAFLD